MEIAIESDNEDFLEWVFEYLEDKHPQCQDNEDGVPRQCLKKWCDLAYAMDEDYAEDLLDYDFFEEYLEGIIEDHINGDVAHDGAPASGFWDADSTSDGYIEDVDDLNQWWIDLCPKS